MGEIIRQTFNLYNTVGLIDKDKNIYFVPHQADIYSKVTASRTKVCDCYYELFNTVSPFSSKYQNTEISQWSPEDRELLIEGSIDDFRQSRGQGLALNYLIINRAIYEVEEETETLISNYYFAMFIDSVEQRGLRSVKLNVTPDYFTNFYYLNNNDTLTSTYDPFNPVMKNCFVERQHYDRFEKVNNVTSYKNLKKILGTNETFTYKYQYKDKRYFMPIDKSITNTRYEEIVNSLKSISSLESFKSFISSLSLNEKIIVSSIFLSYLNVIFKENILTPFSYKNSSNFYYKAGFNTYKGVTVPLTHAVIPYITIPKGFENINKNWIKIGVNVYNAGEYETERYSKLYDFYLEENYSPSRVLDYLQSIGGNQYILTSYISKYSTLQKNIISLVEETNNLRLNFAINIHQKNEVLVPSTISTNILNANETITLSDNALAFLPYSYTEGSTITTYRKVLDKEIGYYFVSGSPAVVSTLLTGNYGYYSITPNIKYGTGSDKEYSINLSHLVFVLGVSEISETELTFIDNIPVNVKNIYREPILETEPYSFYSISINETEQIISKIKMIDNYDKNNSKFTCKISPIISFNDSYKIGIIPSYYINEKWNRYYSDAIVTCPKNEIPIIEESWTTYYSLNKAQMKSQYAIQETRYAGETWKGLWSNLGGMTKSTLGGIRGGSAGVIAGATIGFVNALVDRANLEQDNETQKEVIRISQNAKMSDMGAKPDTVRLSGSDILYTINENERGFYLNYYRIDNTSYNSISKYLERFGYYVSLFDSLNIFDRIGFNFIKLTSFDFVEDDFVLSQEQMNAISRIFEEGVTLLHNHDYLHNLGEVINNVSYHNYELSLA